MQTQSMISGIRPVHPGELLREDVLPATGKSKTEIARLLGIPRQCLYDIINEKQAITVPVALRLGKLFGNGPSLWLNMQQTFDVKATEVVMVAELAAIPTLEVA